MSMAKEFREFIMRGNVVDLAVGVIMGAAFGPIVATLVENVIMPPIGVVLGGVDFSSFQIGLNKDAAIKYGLFLNAVIKFLITAAAIFLVVKTINTAKRRFEKEKALAPPPPPPPSEIYLREIRDALVNR